MSKQTYNKHLKLMLWLGLNDEKRADDTDTNMGVIIFGKTLLNQLNQIRFCYKTINKVC